MTKENDLLAYIKEGDVPQHVAIVMDGNGRWAKKRAMPRVWGHQKGVESVRAVVEAAAEAGVKVLTLYAFSEENWGRPAEEVSAIFSLIDTYVVKERETLRKGQIRFKAIGCLERLAPRTRQLILETEDYLKNETRMLVNVALSYGSRSEITHACRSLAEKVQAGALQVADITADLLAEHLWTQGVPDPDLFIRTSGEKRLSNFLLWQMSYTELYFSPVLWPDFRKEQFFEALLAFQNRDRRYGLLDRTDVPAVEGATC